MMLQNFLSSKFFLHDNLSSTIFLHNEILHDDEDEWGANRSLGAFGFSCYSDFSLT
jgi:hypothetical protein